MKKVAWYCLAAMLFLGFCFGGVLSWHYLVSDLKTAAGVTVMVWATGGIVYAIVAVWAMTQFPRDTKPSQKPSLRSGVDPITPEQVNTIKINRQGRGSNDGPDFIRTLHNLR